MTSTDTDNANVKPSTTLLFYSVLGILSVIALLGLVGFGVSVMSGRGDMGLAWMVIAGGGFLTIVGIMILGAFIYRTMNLHDQAQALGMPQGSVRSLLMFLVFTLLGVFVFFSVDSIGDQHVRSTIVVPASEVVEWTERLGDNIEIISVQPGPSLDSVVNGEAASVPSTEIVFDRIRPASEAVTDHVDKIAIAIFSMASSIIGYYFGTRSQVPPVGLDDGQTNAGNTNVAVPPQGRADSPDWSLDAGPLALTFRDGSHHGEITFASEELGPDHAFGGFIVPPIDNRDQFSDFVVSIDRSGDTLKVQIIGPEDVSLAGAQLSIYPIDHEDVAIAVDLA